jgi:hypothetical protein
MRAAGFDVGGHDGEWFLMPGVWRRRDAVYDPHPLLGFDGDSAKKGSGVLLASAAGVAVMGGVNEVQTVTITGTPTGGTFTLTSTGATTAAIAYNAAASAVASGRGGAAQRRHGQRGRRRRRASGHAGDADLPGRPGQAQRLPDDRGRLLHGRLDPGHRGDHHDGRARRSTPTSCGRTAA